MKRTSGMMFVCLGIAMLLCVCSGYAEDIQLATSDGQTVQALLSGDGETAIVLCHGKGYKDGAASFAKQAEYFATHGIKCLSLSFRGYPSESPPRMRGREKDILAAVDYLGEEGARRIFVLGSSMGGFIALNALSQLEQRDAFSGIILLSAYHPSACTDSKLPKLFVAAEDDSAYYTKVAETFESASTPKQMIAYRTGSHGQTLFLTQKEPLLEAILTFIRTFD